MYDDDRSDEDISKEQSKWTSDEIKRYDTSKLFTHIDVVEKQKKKEENRKKTAALVDENYRSMGRFFKFLFERWHKFVTIPLFILIVAGITMPLWYEPLVANIKKQNAEQAAAEQEKIEQEWVNSNPKNYALKIAQEARGYLTSNDLDTANAIYDEGINKAANDEQKAFLYIAWANELIQYVGTSQITAALEYAQNADTMVQNLDMYIEQNKFYINAGIKEKADYYQAKINEITGQQQQSQGVGKALDEETNTEHC